MPKVFVAISGGVDSSVAALLLKRAGFEVAGVFMRFWADSGFGNWNRCCSLDSERQAKAVALKLRIPFYVFDFEKEFKKNVVDRFLKQIKAGLTPNPCVVCNEEIKFGLFLKKSLKTGADLIATGHYVRIQDTRLCPAKRDYGGQAKYKLFKAEDGNKDQSYFLWRLGQEQLKRVIFPLGNYTKSQVREIAKKAGLPTAMAKESQNLCFLGNDLVGFLKKHSKIRPGSIADKNGRIIGKHLGLGFYTIGQSQGFGADIFPKEQSQGPYFVLRKEMKKNLLIVTKNKKDLLNKECLIENVNWISGKASVLPLRAMVKIRSQQIEMPAMILKTKKTGRLLIRFAKPQPAITPGQSAVFYREGELIGGGIILTFLSIGFLLL